MKTIQEIDLSHVRSIGNGHPIKRRGALSFQFEDATTAILLLTEVGCFRAKNHGPQEVARLVGPGSVCMVSPKGAVQVVGSMPHFMLYEMAAMAGEPVDELYIAVDKKMPPSYMWASNIEALTALFEKAEWERWWRPWTEEHTTAFFAPERTDRCGIFIKSSGVIRLTGDHDSAMNVLQPLFKQCP